MEKRLNTRRRLSILFTIIIMFFCIPLTALGEPVKVAILPFAIHADKDYSFLQKGIVQMLTSRLSEPGKVTVIDPITTENAVSAIQGMSGDGLARQVGKQTGADLAIHGSLTILGDSVSIDAKTIDITGGRQSVTFFKQTQGLGNVIGQINLIAGEFNSQFFGVSKPAPSAMAATAPITAVPQAPTTPASGKPDVHMHPEKLLQRGQPISSGSDNVTVNPLAKVKSNTQAKPLNPAFVTTRSVTSDDEPTLWKSRNFKELINGIDVGDVDGDGLLETVLAMPEKIMVLRFSQGRRQTVAEIKTSRTVRNISVSLGDINRNGRPEIFVTSFALPLDTIHSSVLEFDGQEFKTIVELSRYYYTVIQHPVLGQTLLGQLQRGENDVFSGAVYEMEWKGADYVEGRKIVPANKANVLGMAYGDIMSAQSDSIVALDGMDKIRIISSSGRLEWKSSDSYGGTPLYFALPTKQPDDNEFKFFLPIRIRTYDLDKDGKLEVLAPRNEGGVERSMLQQRYFTKSQIEALVWDGQGLSTAWKTRQLSGRVQDLIVSDFDNDGTQELLAAIITKEGAVIFADAHCNLIAFDLNLAN